MCLHGVHVCVHGVHSVYMVYAYGPVYMYVYMYVYFNGVYMVYMMYIVRSTYSTGMYKCI